MYRFAFTTAAALAGGTAMAQVSLTQDAADFGVRESVSTVDLSPSGNQVVYIAPAPNGATVALVADVNGGPVRPILKAAGGAERLSWCGFVTEARLICGYEAVVKQYDLLIPYSRLIAINADGSAMKQLGQSASFYDSRLRQFDGAVVDWLPGSGGDVLMSREYVPETGRTASSHISRSDDGLGVDRVNTLTLASKPVESARRGASNYLSDGRGNVRLMMFDEYDGTGRLTGRTKVNYRVAGSREWRTLVDYGGEELTPLAVDGLSDALYALKKKDGRDALYRIRLTNPPVTELVGEHPKVDIDSVIRSANGQHVIGYSFVDDIRETIYFDPEYKALHATLGKALPKLPLIRFVGTSADGKRVLVYAGSDSDPGRYFLFDRTSKQLNELFLVRPQLEHRALAPVKPVSVKVADGTMVPAYLTLPVGKEAKGLPAVVLPHGGPSSRDEWGFDWLAQFLAARGYAVLQPNYRGSAGFGDHWLIENGFKSWRTSVGDITGSARWMVEQGIADPKRLAIVGWSYGGYAALQAAATDPALFGSVAAIAPVTDLSMLKEEADNFTNSRLVREFVGSGPHIAEGSPLRLAGQIKVPVLLAHGDKDNNVGVGHSLKMAEALRANGSTVELLRYPALDHQLEDSEARRELLRKIGALLDGTIGH